jgi:hypothetical protein
MAISTTLSSFLPILTPFTIKALFTSADYQVRTFPHLTNSHITNPRPAMPCLPVLHPFSQDWLAYRLPRSASPSSAYPSHAITSRLKLPKPAKLACNTHFPSPLPSRRSTRTCTRQHPPLQASHHFVQHHTYEPSERIRVNHPSNLGSTSI